jgi:hypothetical protein
MITQIPYGSDVVSIELPERTVTISSMEKTRLQPAKDLSATARTALASPLGSPTLPEIVNASSRVTIAFDDATVSSFGPVRGAVIKELLTEMRSAGVKDDNIVLICANSLHRKFRPEELAKLIGEDLVQAFGPRLMCHDAEDPDVLVYLGKTPGGYDVEINRHVMESDLTVYVNAGHNRGFSGGWKSVCVGLSTYRSIRHHHTPDGMSMSIKNNRMHRMLDEMGKKVESNIRGKIFKIDTILANPLEAARIFAGSVWETRKKVLEVQAGLFEDRRALSAEKFDVLIYSIPNWSPYAIYSYMNPLLTLISSGLGYLAGTVQALGNPGCSVIMVTPCPDRWDTVHHASYPEVWNDVLSKTLDPYEIEAEYAGKFASHEAYIEKYRHNYAFHPVHAILATYPLKRLGHIGRVFVAGAKDPEVVRHIGFTPTESVEAALRLAEPIHGKDFPVAHVLQPVPPVKLTM